MDVKVLIAGAGPTGLTLAIELARRDIPVRIIDKAEKFFEGSRGDGLQPRTLEVFEDLGVLDAVMAASAAEFPMRVYVGGEYVGERRTSEHVEPSRASRGPRRSCAPGSPSSTCPSNWATNWSRSTRTTRA